MEAQAQPQHHPIRLVVNDDLRRNRLTVFFRLLLAIPHVVWFLLWGIVAALAALVNWFATLFIGKSPDGLHNFLATYLRYQTHVYAYVLLIADPFPGFGGQPGYPIDLEVAPAEPQNRLTVFFRLILAIPAWIISSIMGYLNRALAIFSWFVALVMGSLPEGMRNFAAFALRYEQQTMAYAYLLTQRYPSFNVSVSE
jgi:small-conductance mechanosensitive channel